MGESGNCDSVWQIAICGIRLIEFNFDEKLNTPWLAFGSFLGRIKMVKLNPDLKSVTATTRMAYDCKTQRGFELADSRSRRYGALEAPYFLKGKNDIIINFFLGVYAVAEKKVLIKLVIGEI